METLYPKLSIKNPEVLDGLAFWCFRLSMVMLAVSLLYFSYLLVGYYTCRSAAAKKSFLLRKGVAGARGKGGKWFLGFLVFFLTSYYLKYKM
ncbi:hypothetical protein V9K67_21410 [Paraflavisolibacter sp. H34]|uniref:hypothetical protein n=1 Tax=Huijunlia imazamoxiresistens TaxID=3127457 RepID=UPI0030195875